MKDPVLKTIYYAKKKDIYCVKITGGLHYIQGNSAPYFSLTNITDVRTPSGLFQEVSFGCDNTMVVRLCPEYQNLADLHLSDIHGVPMHAVANGWYWFVGASDYKYGERYHGGTSTSKERCLKILAKYLRVSLEEARSLSFPVENVDDKIHIGMTVEEINKLKAGTLAKAKGAFEEYVLSHKPRWKAEAEACIAKHNLEVYGDPWPTT